MMTELERLADLVERAVGTVNAESVARKALLDAVDYMGHMTAMKKNQEAVLRLVAAYRKIG